MKKLLPTLFLFSQISLLFSQTKAITEYGDTIYIYNNGTWAYEILDAMPQENLLDYLKVELDIDSVDKKLSAPLSAKKKVTNKNNQFIINYDESKWKRVPPASLNDEAEFAFECKEFDAWCIVISEETEISKENLFKIAKNTMEENAGSEAEIIQLEYITVNETPILRGVMKTTFSDISFIFDTYYFSNEIGSVQFTTWTSQKLWEKNNSKIQELLNGFVSKS